MCHSTMHRQSVENYEIINVDDLSVYKKRKKKKRTTKRNDYKMDVLIQIKLTSFVAFGMVDANFGTPLFTLSINCDA